MPKNFADVFVITAANIPEMYMIIGIIATYVAGCSKQMLRYSGIYACEIFTKSREDMYRRATW